MTTVTVCHPVLPVALARPGYMGRSVTTVTVCHSVLPVALARPGYMSLSVTTVTVCHSVLSAPLLLNNNNLHIYNRNNGFYMID